MSIEYDVELALPQASTEAIGEIEQGLPAEYEFEDRCDEGRGIVIHRCDFAPSSATQAVEEFLAPLASLAGVLRASCGVLRIGAFHTTVTCTIAINSSVLLSQLGIALHVTTYPCAETDPDEEARSNKTAPRLDS